MSRFAMSKFATKEARAEAMGYDAGLVGPDAENCHYSSFATPAEKAAWERGLKRGQAEREQKKPSPFHSQESK